MSSTDQSLRDPDIVRFIQAKAEKAAALIEGIATLEARADKRALRQAKVMRRELRAIQASIENAREVELQRDAEMGEARDPLIRAKMRGHVVTVKEAETADFARDEHGARIINRRGPARGLPALVYSRGTRTRILTGIHHAFDAGHLDDPRTGSGGEALLEVGQAYEAAYAKSDPLKAVDPSQVGGGGFGPRGPQAAAVEAAEWLRIARRGLDARQLAVLDAICGEGMTAAQVRTARKWGWEATLQALRSGLVLVAKNQREATETGARVVASRLRAGGQIQELRKAI